MQFTALFALASALGAMASPTGYTQFKKLLKSRADGGDGPTDVQILQYALTLEHLEDNFYHGALDKYSADDFAAAGYPDWVRGRISQIAGHEADHVAFLSGALGNTSVAACEYSFPYTDVTSFISLAATIENVGVSAYAGAAQYITTADYLTAAAVILSTEARHQAWENSAALMGAPWSSGFDTPLGLDMVYTIASAFITSCPDSNAALPVMAFPALTVGSGMPGDQVQFTFDDAHNATNYAVFYSGLGSKACMLDENDMTYIPGDLQGFSYVVISTASDPTMVSPDNIVAGPAIQNFGLSAWATSVEFGLGLNGTETMSM